jgi:hypothetical protein
VRDRQTSEKKQTEDSQTHGTLTFRRVS